jgi:hypothetical protein
MVVQFQINSPSLYHFYSLTFLVAPNQTIYVAHMSDEVLPFGQEGNAM